MAVNSQRYLRSTYLFMCTDPVHVGTGGYRLGRVDNSIAKEPGTNVPKIPGTSLHGAARAYSASLYEKTNCAGQGQQKNGDTTTGHCGCCKICYTFGYTKSANSTESYSGVVNVYDAQLLFFPVNSMVGPVWITTPARLEMAGFTIGGFPESWNTETVFPTFEHVGSLNLGWLVFNTGGQVTISNYQFSLPRDKRWKQMSNHVVLVHDNMFSHLVNSNLEVRTSVAIDPERGAAIDKALFTYEALPRTTVLMSDVVLDDYRKTGFDTDGIEHNRTSKGNLLPGEVAWNSALDVLNSGLKMIEWLGVGGMGTRGFGRMAVLGIPKDETYAEETKS